MKVRLFFKGIADFLALIQFQMYIQLSADTNTCLFIFSPRIPLFYFLNSIY